MVVDSHQKVSSSPAECAFGPSGDSSSASEEKVKFGVIEATSIAKVDQFHSIQRLRTGSPLYCLSGLVWSLDLRCDVGAVACCGESSSS